MVITILIIATIGLFFSVVLAKSSVIRSWFITLFLVLFIGMIALLVANDTYHYGLKKVTQTDTETLVTSAPTAKKGTPDVLLYKALGDGTEKIYLYRTNLSQKKPQPTPLEHATVHVDATETSSATLVKQITRWQYTNAWMHTLFAMSGENGDIAHRTYTFQIPTTWLQLSTTQASQLSKLLKQPATQQTLKTAVTKKVISEFKKHPDLPANQHIEVEQLAQKSAIMQLLK